MATTMDGALEFPVFEVFGKFGWRAELSLPLPLARGVLLETLEAALSIPLPIVDGVLDSPQVLEGTLSLPSFSIRSELGWGGSLEIPLLTVGGNLSVPIVLYGDLNLLALNVSGYFKAELALYGDLDLPKWEVDSAIWAGVYMSGEAVLPSLKVNGTLIRNVDSVFVGALTMPVFEVSGIIDYTATDPTLIYSRGTTCQA